MTEEQNTGTQYTCAACGREFVSARPDEEARQEVEQLWGKEALKDPVVICDDCFQANIGRFN